MKLVIILSLFVALAPVPSIAMDVGSATALSTETVQLVRKCASGACVSKLLKSAKKEMNGMPVLSKTSSALSKVIRAIKKTCNGGCDASAIAAIQKEVAKQSAKLSKSKHKQDQAFAAFFTPANFSKKQLAK